MKRSAPVSLLGLVLSLAAAGCGNAQATRNHIEIPRMPFPVYTVRGSVDGFVLRRVKQTKSQLTLWYDNGNMMVPLIEQAYVGPLPTRNASLSVHATPIPYYIVHTATRVGGMDEGVLYMTGTRIYVIWNMAENQDGIDSIIANLYAHGVRH